MEGGKGWSREMREISKGLKEQMSCRAEERRAGKRNMTSLSEKKSADNSSHLFHVNKVNSSVRRSGSAHSLRATHAVYCCNTCQ